MAIKFEQKKPLNAIEVISTDDDAIDKEASDIDGYLETGEVSKLKFIPNKQPTIFLCNFNLKGFEAEEIQNAVLSKMDRSGKPGYSIGSYAFKIAKICLKEIKNPADLPSEYHFAFKKDKDGYVHDDLLAILNQYGIIGAIFNMYNALTGKKAEAKN